MVFHQNTCNCIKQPGTYVFIKGNVRQGKAVSSVIVSCQGIELSKRACPDERYFLWPAYLHDF